MLGTSGLHGPEGLTGYVSAVRMGGGRESRGSLIEERLKGHSEHKAPETSGAGRLCL